MRLLPALIAAIVVTSWSILAARWMSGVWGPIDPVVSVLWTLFVVAITAVLWSR